MKMLINAVIPSRGPCHIVCRRIFCSFPDNRPNIDITRYIFPATAVFDCRKIVQLYETPTEDALVSVPEDQRTKGFFLNSISFCTNIQPGENESIKGEMPISPLTGALIDQNAAQSQFEEGKKGTQLHCFPTGKAYSLMLGYGFPFILSAHKTNRWMQHTLRGLRMVFWEISNWRGK